MDITAAIPLLEKIRAKQSEVEKLKASIADVEEKIIAGEAECDALNQQAAELMGWKGGKRKSNHQTASSKTNTEDIQKRILDLLADGKPRTGEDIKSAMELDSSPSRVLKLLVDSGKLKKEGKRRSTTYSIA